MGGHDHLPKVPSPDIYKIEDVPQLKRFEEFLAEKNLKDPWLRNLVWRIEPEKVYRKRLLNGCFRSVKYAIPAFLITIGIETYFGIDYGHHGKHDDDDDNH